MDRPLQKLLPVIVATALVGAAISVGSAGGAADAASHPDAGEAAGGATQAGRHVSCPSHDQLSHAIQSPRGDATTALVPNGEQQVLLCRYSGLNDRPRFTLVKHRLIAEEATVASIAGEMNRLPTLGNVACPADFGTQIIAFFRYGSGPDDPVTVDLTGCQTVTNGNLTLTASRSSLVRRLETLAPIKSAPGAKRDATIRGYVWLCGGPAPGGCRVATIGTCTPGAGCVTTDRVTVTNGDGTQVAAAKLRHARFSTKVPAGRYTVTLLADGRHVHGRVIQTQTVTARAGRTTTVKFEFDVP